MAEQWGREKDSELGVFGGCTFSGYKFDDVSDVFPAPGKEPAQRMADFNNNMLSFVCDEYCDHETDGLDWTVLEALAANDKEGKSEFRMPSGPVNEAELPPVSVPGVTRSLFRRAWQEAMDAKMKGHVDSKTFTVIDKLSKSKKAVGSRWVLLYKAGKDGQILKTKARLVAQGFIQVQDVGLFNTSAPTLAGASVKTVMAVANELDFKVFHFDVSQAFVQAGLDCGVFMKLPGGCGELSGKYVSLEKALYDLRQSDLLWNGLLVKKVVKHGMEQCKTDPCVFRLGRKGKVVLILAVHVDGISVAGSEEEVDLLHVALNEDFTTNNLGELTWYTGCGFSRDLEKGTYNITQTAFIETFAKRFDVTTTSLYPASHGVNLGAKEEGESGGTWPYREAVGGLMWLVTMLRPDITNSARAVARHSHNPTPRHWKAVLMVIEYFLGTKELGLTFALGSGLELSVYTDADYADKANDRRSVSGVEVTLGNTVVSWMSSTQNSVSLSTAQGEYVALGDGVKEALFAMGVLSFMVPPVSDKCIKVFVDNQGAIALATDPLSLARTKHIDVRYHFVRELVRSKTIAVVYVPTKEQHVDILTKTLTCADFRFHRGFLMNLHG